MSIFYLDSETNPKMESNMVSLLGKYRDIVKLCDVIIVDPENPIKLIIVMENNRGMEEKIIGTPIQIKFIYDHFKTPKPNLLVKYANYQL